MSKGPTLWWAYDSDSGEFSTLPTGPFLIPALIIAGLTAIFGSLSHRSPESIHSELAKTPEWKQKQIRYDYLIEQAVANCGDISPAERYELNQLKSYFHNPYGYPIRKH